MNQLTIFDIIRSGDYLVLDTETTGLHSGAEICQIAIIDSNGNPLLDTLVKPVNGIPAEATAIHGITEEMVKDAPIFPSEEIYDIVKGRNVIVYNADYDVTMLYRSVEAHDNKWLEHSWRENSEWYCAMEAFARIYGDWNARYKSFKWKTLQTACGYYGIHNAGAHSALSDAMATLAVCKAMVAEKVKSSYDTL